MKRARRLFDFSVVDPAMGSAHFLTAALDTIADRIEIFLAEVGGLPGIAQLLSELSQDSGAACPTTGGWRPAAETHTQTLHLRCGPFPDGGRGRQRHAVAGVLRSRAWPSLTWGATSSAATPSLAWPTRSVVGGVDSAMFVGGQHDNRRYGPRRAATARASGEYQTGAPKR